MFRRGGHDVALIAVLRDLIVTPGQADTVCPLIVAELCLILWQCAFRLALLALSAGARAWRRVNRLFFVHELARYQAFENRTHW